MDPLEKLNLDIATLGVHAGEHLANTNDVTPGINVTTTFKYPDNQEPMSHEEELEAHDSFMVYSRLAQPVTVRAERVIGSVSKAHAVLYGSGLAAFHAAMIHLNPKRVFISQAYFGVHAVLGILKRNYNVEVSSLDQASEAKKGDLIHVETPVNPYGISYDLSQYAKIAKDTGALLMVDATFAPPPLSNPFDHGADIVMHSATKYFGGHSDLLAGVLLTKDEQVKKQLLSDRDHLGSNVGSLESWLLLRSVKTLDMRVRTQAANAEKIVKYLVENKDKLPKLKSVQHSSLQTEEFVKKQLPLGGPPVFSIETVDRQSAKDVPAKVKLFAHATSLGGVESLIEWRVLSDASISDTLLRVSVGVESADDLINDLAQALK
uniref:ARAD1C13618p n=1 Tax=Blastobotrys adeninivorans TaxID=409370 RepID=A0A060T144_BLAAD